MSLMKMRTFINFTAIVKNSFSVSTGIFKVCYITPGMYIHQPPFIPRINFCCSYQWGVKLGMLVDHSCENWFWEPNPTPIYSPPTFDLALLFCIFPFISLPSFQQSQPRHVWRLSLDETVIYCCDFHRPAFQKKVKLALGEISSQMSYITPFNTTTCVLYSLHESRRILVCRNCTLNGTVSLLSHGRMICYFRIGWGGRESKCSAINS